jgi:hypothetical protein
MGLVTHNTARFGELVPLNKGNDGFADVLGVAKKDLAGFSVALLRGQILCKVTIKYTTLCLGEVRTSNTVCHRDDVLGLNFLKLSKLK